MKGIGSNSLKIACLLSIVVLLTAVGARRAEALTAAGTTITNTATVNYSDGSGNSFSATGSVSVTVDPVYFVTVACTTANQSAPSNTTVYYACTVTNSGNDSNTYALTASATNGWGNPTLYHDLGVVGTYEGGTDVVTASTGSITAGTTYNLLVAVAIPANTPNGTTSEFTLNAVGSADAGAGDDGNVKRTTTAQAPAITVTKKVRNVTTNTPAGAYSTGPINAKPGETLEYQVTVINNGTITATAVILTDPLNSSYLTYEPGSLYSGANTPNSGNTHNTDAVGDETCAANVCATAKINAGTVTFAIGNGATDAAIPVGGTFTTGSTIYLYYQAKVQ